MKLTENIKALVFISVLIGIAVLSLLPPKQVELGNSDKVSHFFAYLVLMVTLGLWQGKNLKFLSSIFLLISYGVLLEFLQGFIPGREPSVFDSIANSIGVIIGAVWNFIKIRRGF